LLFKGYFAFGNVEMERTTHGIQLSIKLIPPIIGLFISNWYKIISSVDPIHANPEFDELHRRLLVIRHKRFDKFQADDFDDSIPSFDIENKIDIDSIHWGGIEDKFMTFWNDPGNCKYYASQRGILTRKNARFERPESLNSDRWTVSVDIIVTGAVLGVWDLQTGVNHLAKYWEWVTLMQGDSESAFLQHLQEFIESEVGTLLKLQDKARGEGMAIHPIIIDAKKLQNTVNALHREGRLDVYPNVQIIGTAMQSLGWRLTTSGWKQIL
jgi:hypothetical protein